MMKIAFLVLLNTVAHAICAQNAHEYVRGVVSELDKVQSASYAAHYTVSAPGDTTEFKTIRRLEKEIFNTSDKTIGSTFAWFSSSNPDRMEFFYNGAAGGYMDWEKKLVSIDSFKTNRLSFRPIGPPFFNYVKSILKYILETKDDITLHKSNLGDSVHLSITIHHDVIEFFGNDLWYTDPASLAYMGEIRSQYDIWVRKTDNLPYRMTRQMPHNKSTYAISSVRINDDSGRKFSPAEHIPKEFSVTSRKTISLRKHRAINDLLGTAATPWRLADVKGDSVSLKDIHSKILMVQFTGIGCGPCHQSLGFLKQLVTDYSKSDFEMVSIETWSKNHDGIKRYVEKNALNYKFLKSEGNVTENYRIYSVPVFFIMDEQRVIRKIISGYSQGTTDKAIREAIEKLL